jgi:hypothetical protein
MSSRHTGVPDSSVRLLRESAGSRKLCAAETRRPFSMLWSVWLAPSMLGLPLMFCFSGMPCSFEASMTARVTGCVSAVVIVGIGPEPPR